MASEDTKEVVAGVVNYSELYLMGKRRRDGFYEFIGGKVKEDETYPEAFVREFEEETREREDEKGIKFDEELVERTAESYPSEDNPDFDIVPVLIYISEEEYKQIQDLEPIKLPDHDELRWVDLDEFERMDSDGLIKGQRKCLERLDIL